MYPRPYVHPLSKGYGAPVATGGKAQPRSPHGPKLPKPKKITVKAHTRTIQPKPPKIQQAPPNTDQALIDAAVRSRFGPQEQALGAQLSQNARYSSGLGDWYKNAVDQIRGIQAGAQANAQQNLAQVTNYASQATLPNATDQQAANARNNLNAEFASKMAQDATSNSGALDRLQAAYALQQGNSANQANAQRMGLLGQQGALGQAKADYGLQYGTQLHSAEQKAAMDQANLQVKQGTLAYLTGNAQSEAQNRVAEQKVARSNARTQRQRAISTKAKQRHDAMLGDKKYQLDVQKAGHQTAKDNYQRAHGLGPYKPAAGTKGGGRYTQANLNKYDNQWRGAQALAQHLKAAKTYVDKATKKTLPVDRNTVYSALLKKYPNDPEFAGAAADFAFGKKLSKHDLHLLAMKGIHPGQPTPPQGPVKNILGPTVKGLGQ